MPGLYEGGRRNMRQALIVATMATLVCLTGVSTVSAEWDPQAFADEETLELLTISEEEGEYWFPVWLVVLDDAVFVRLGTRAAERVEANKTAPLLGVRIAGEEFSRVKAVDEPDMAERVADAMGEKYWSDVFIKYFPHPLTMRLTPEP